METTISSSHVSTSISGLLEKYSVFPFSKWVVESPTVFLVAPVVALCTIMYGSWLFRGASTVDRDATAAVAASVKGVPYWIPFLGNAFAFFTKPAQLMSEARNNSPHGIFNLKIGPATLNIISSHRVAYITNHIPVSNPGLVKSVMQQKESTIQFRPTAWSVMVKFFGTPKRSKDIYFLHWDAFATNFANTIMREPFLGALMKATVDRFQHSIPEMISFTASVIDQQPWERSSDCTLVSSKPQMVEVNLLSLLRDLMGSASVPAFFGQSFLENYPHTLQDIYDMDSGMIYLLMGFPRWFPIPGVAKAHIARRRLWDSTIDFYQAYDDFLDGKAVDARWGEMDDVSEVIKGRTLIYKDNDFAPGDRAEISILWALVINANVAVYWMILHILAQPDLATRIREEINPYVKVSKGESIGAFSEAPKLAISHEALGKSCPLLRAAFFETLRLCNQPWSVRQMAHDGVISTSKSDGAQTPISYGLKKGEHVTIPHDLHMLDPTYFPEPTKFRPERFLQTAEDGSVSVNIGSIRPFGGGPSMCKGRVYAERECLSFVAGILGFYDIEPADPMGWVIPAQQKASAISLPIGVTRVKIKRRTFDWEI